MATAGTTKIKRKTKNGKSSANVTVIEASEGQEQPGEVLATPLPEAQLTELERVSLAALDAEMRNAGQGIRIADLEWERVQREFQQQQQIYAAKKSALVEKFSEDKKRYNRFITELGVRYSIDPHHMTFDTETGILREVRQGAQ